MQVGCGCVLGSREGRMGKVGVQRAFQNLFARLLETPKVKCMSGSGWGMPVQGHVESRKMMGACRHVCLSSNTYTSGLTALIVSPSVPPNTIIFTTFPNPHCSPPHRHQHHECHHHRCNPVCPPGWQAHHRDLDHCQGVLCRQRRHGPLRPLGGTLPRWAAARQLLPRRSSTSAEPCTRHTCAARARSLVRLPLVRIPDRFNHVIVLLPKRIPTKAPRRPMHSFAPQARPVPRSPRWLAMT